MRIEPVPPLDERYFDISELLVSKMFPNVDDSITIAISIGDLKAKIEDAYAQYRIDMASYHATKFWDDCFMGDPVCSNPVDRHPLECI